MSLDLASQPTSDTRDGLGPLHSNEIIIGLALGSPRDNNFPSLPDEYYENNHPSPPPSRTGLRSGYSDSASQFSQSSPPRQPARPFDGLKRSGSKWKNIGALFGKKGTSAPPFDGQPFYMLDRPVQRNIAQPPPTRDPEPFDQGSVHDPSHKIITPLETRAQTICSAEPPRQTGAKAILRRASTRRLGIRKRPRAQTGGSLENNRGSPARIRLEERGPSGEATEESAWLKHHGHEDLETPAGSLWLSRQQRLLEVEIPNVELERYSVMFGDVLNTRPGKAGIRSSRRQSQLRDLKPALTEKENFPCGPTLLSPLSSNPPLAPNPVRPEHARMDSSSSSGSKSSTGSAKYGLFPPVGPLQKRNTAHKPPPKPSPLSRSVTAPNTNTTPFPQPAVSTSKPHGPNELMIVIQETEDHAPPNESLEKPLGRQHQRSSSFDPSDLATTASPDDQFYYDDQFEDDEEEEEYIRPSTANPSLKAQTFSRSAFPVRKSSMKVPRNTPATSPPLPPSETVPTPPVPTAEALTPAPLSISKKPKPLTTTGEVSVARQISITRARTVVPIVPQVARQPPTRTKMVDHSYGSREAFPVRKDSHQSYEVAVEG